MKFILSKENILSFIFLTLLFIIYYLINYNTGVWNIISDPIYYINIANYISERVPLINRLENIELIIDFANAPHFLYPLLLSYSKDIFKNYYIFILQYLLFISASIQIYLLIDSYKIKQKSLNLILVVISSGLIFWGSIPLKESLLVNLYLLLYRYIFIQKVNSIFRLFSIIIILFLFSITRYWYQLFLLVNIIITFSLPNFINSITKFKVKTSFLLIIPIMSFIFINIKGLLSRININPLLIIKNIVSPNPINLLNNENLLYLPSTLLFKCILILSIIKILKNYKKIIFNNEYSFLIGNYILTFTALSDSVLRGERHKLIALLSLSLFFVISQRKNNQA